MEFKRLLYMSEHPPGSVGGQPLIVRRLLEDYDMARLDVLCDARYHQPDPESGASLLPCRHTTIRNFEGRSALRPRRLFGAISNSVNALRIGQISRVGRRIIAARGVQAILTVPWRCEFAMAAYRLSLSTGLPLYVFETDDWAAMNPHGLPGRLVRRHRVDLLRRAKKLWVTSEEMVTRYRDRFGVEGEFLFYYLDPTPYLQASAARVRLSDDGVLRLVYTGAINTMFFDTMRYLCEQINRGMEVHGRRVALNIYGSGMPAGFEGPHVSYRGLVPPEAIPGVLASADACLVGVTFSRRDDLVKLVTTSLYTKTIDYLASGRPVLIVAPSYTAEVRYFREVASVVDTLEADRVEDALAGLAQASAAISAQCDHGIEMVRQRHSVAHRDEIFLSAFAT